MPIKCLNSACSSETFEEEYSCLENEHDNMYHHALKCSLCQNRIFIYDDGNQTLQHLVVGRGGGYYYFLQFSYNSGQMTFSNGFEDTLYINNNIENVNKYIKYQQLRNFQ